MYDNNMSMKELLASINARYAEEEALASCEAPTFETIIDEEPLKEKKEIKKEKKKEEKPKIYIPNFAFPFKRISNHDKEKSTYDLMMENLFIDKDAGYLFNRSGLFHGGIHLNGAKFCGNTFDKENVRAIADGKVIAYRINDEALENEVGGETLLYTTSFFLIEHYMEYPVGNKLKFYSLYLHMAAKEEYEFPTYVLCGSKEYVRIGSASGDGVPNTFGKEITLTGEKVGNRFVVATLDDEKPSENLVVDKSNLMKKEELHTTTTKGTGINLRYHQKNCKSWKSLKIATDELKAGVSIVVASKKLKCNRYEVISVGGKFIVESNDKEDKTKKVEQMVSISASNLTKIPKVPKKSKDTFENGLVSEKMKTNKVVELEEKEQIEVKAGDILGKLGLYSYDWIEEPVVHLEVFTFDDVKVFQKNATKAYEKEDEEKKYKVGGKESTPLVQGWRNSSWALEEQVHYVKAGTPISVTQRKKKVGAVIRQEVIEVDGSDELVKEGVWTIWEKQVEVEGKKDERPKVNILYVPKETTELYLKKELDEDKVYARVKNPSKKGTGTNIRKGMSNDGTLYKFFKNGTLLLLDVNGVIENRVEETMSTYFRQKVLEIDNEKVSEPCSVHTEYFKYSKEEIFEVKPVTTQKLITKVVKPIKNLKIKKDKDGIEYIEVAKFPSLYVKKYKDKKQTKSWFSHGVTLKMFDVMSKEGTDKIGIFEDTVSFYDKREENKKTQEEKEKLNPLFNEVLQKLKIDKDKNGKLEAGELAGLMLTQEKQKELSYIVAKHESEWKDPTRFEALATFMDEMKATEYATMMRDRTKKLSFFDDVMAMKGSPTFFHPLALVGAMVGEDCNSLVWGKKFTSKERKKIIIISKRLKCDPNYLTTAMALETGGKFDPSIVNSLGYTGLIQIGATAAKDINQRKGTSISAGKNGTLSKMTKFEQLTYVEYYLERYKGKLNTLVDFYLAILFPVDCGKGTNPNHVVFDKSLHISYRKDGTAIRNLNWYRHKGYDANGTFKREGTNESGKTYVWEIDKAIQSWYEKGKKYKNECEEEIEELKEETMGIYFPLSFIPKESYITGARKFASNRRGGRKHAGCDLYAPVGTNIYAMDDGEIIAHREFYLNTNQIIVKHKSFIARYGEVKPKGEGIVSGLKVGSKVTKGQHIGYVGKLVFESGTVMSMLHLELYEGNKTGSLSTSNLPYKRRSDLINPTKILDEAQKNLPNQGK